MLLSRLKRLWLGFWSDALGGAESANQSLAALGAIEQQRRHLRSVRDALTNLIFQRKKLTDQLQTIDLELVELRADVQEAAATDRDELAVHLLARLETVEGEQRFLVEQISILEKDVTTARDTEKTLARDIAQAEQLVATLKSRHHALSIRRQLQSQLTTLTRAANGTLATQPLADQVNRLEAELEMMQVKRESWEKDWDDMRAKRSKSRHEQTLSHLKSSLRSRTLPQVIVAEPVR